MSETKQYPGIGTAVYIRKEGKLLLGKRLGKTGHNTWCPPGGRLELFEDLIENTVRETREEAGVEIKNIRCIQITNDIDKDNGAHFVTFHFAAEWVSGEPRDEDGKIGQWGWYEWGNLPEPLFWCAKRFVETGINPLEFNG